MTNRQSHWLSVYIVLLLISAVLTWFSQSSINAYWQQTYHQTSILEPLNRFSWWTKGAQLSQWFNQHYATAQEWVNGKNQQWREANPTQEPENPAADEEALAGRFASFNQAVQNWAKITNPNLEDSLVKNEPMEDNPKGDEFALRKGDVVFFAGDSLMQGVAPYVSQWLTEHHIHSINLSKQSTGLSYPSFFDWPKTIREQLKQNPNIKALLVFLGPNDPWDFPNPKNPAAKYLKFQSEEWETIYRSRINQIIDDAHQANVKVIWLGVPFMRQKRLESQMQYINGLIKDEVEKRATYIPMNTVLSGGNTSYQENLEIDGKMTKIRSKDGIHFTRSGVQFIAKYLRDYLPILEESK